MSGDQKSETEDGFKVYRSSPLPSCSQPLVFVVWRSYPQNGDAIFDVRYFIVTEHAVTHAKGVKLEARYLAHGEDGSVTIEDVVTLAQDQALLALEDQAVREIAMGKLIAGFFQPVILHEISQRDLVRLARRSAWTDRWMEIKKFSPYSSLNRFLRKIEDSPLTGLDFEDLSSR